MTRAAGVEGEAGDRREVSHDRRHNLALGDAVRPEAVVPQAAVDDVLRVGRNDEQLRRLRRERPGKVSLQRRRRRRRPGRRDVETRIHLEGEVRVAAPVERDPSVSGKKSLAGNCDQGVRDAEEGGLVLLPRNLK